jgi:hypothetical protein
LESCHSIAALARARADDRLRRRSPFIPTAVDDP